jgi:hypothetical protein
MIPLVFVVPKVLGRRKTARSNSKQVRAKLTQEGIAYPDGIQISLAPISTWHLHAAASSLINNTDEFQDSAPCPKGKIRGCAYKNDHVAARTMVVKNFRCSWDTAPVNVRGQLSGVFHQDDLPGLVPFWGLANVLPTDSTTVRVTTVASMALRRCFPERVTAGGRSCILRKNSWCESYFFRWVYCCALLVMPRKISAGGMKPTTGTG